MNTAERVELASDRIDPAAIQEMEPRIRPWIRRTPLFETDPRDFGLDELQSGTLSLKLELLQHAGSFKSRGAFANLLTRPVPKAGVVAASGGNHGLAVAYAAGRLRIPAKIFVPVVASPEKIARIRDYGADLTVTGDRYADALAASERWAEESGALRIHAFDQRETLLGQGTLGMELEGQAASASLGGLDTILVAVGGGGLISGISAWFDGSIRIVGVEPEGAPTLTRAMESGRPVDAETGSVAADSLAPKRVGELVFPIASRFVDRVVLVSDEEILAAQRALWSTVRIVAEPGGAAAFGALLSRKYQPAAGERVAALVCGGNTTAVTFS
jgi:threonine dehydratase